MDFFEVPENFDFDASVEPTTAYQPQVPEKHLDSPILISLLERLQDLMSKVLAANKDLKPCQYDIRRIHAIHLYLKKYPLEGFSSIRQPLCQYSAALDYCLKPPVILEARTYPYLFSLSAHAPYRLHSDYKIAREIFDLEIRAYANQLEDVLGEKGRDEFIGRYAFEAMFSTEVVTSSSRAQLWSDIVERYRKEYKSRGDRIKYTIGPVRFICCDGFLLLKTDDLESWQLLTYEQLQMIQDCCIARHNVELSVFFKFHNGSAYLRHHVQEILDWQESILLAYGNKGYELVKAPEAVFKAHLNSLTQGDLLSYSSYDRTIDKMKKKEAKDDPSTPLINRLHRIVQRVDSIYDAAELFGLTKLSGHPCVYAELSMESVRKEAEPAGTILPFAVRQMERMFKHISLSGYINEHQGWPPFTCPPALNSTLRRHYVNRVTTLPLGSYPLTDLDSIIFGKWIEYDYSEDYLKFLDDKAICPGAAEMAKFWFSDPREEPRRLLEKILKLKHFDTRDMVEKLRRGKFDPDEYVIELTQKERELKCAARCFCKLPFRVRTFFTSTEYNLKEQFMKKYIPQQTMTMSNTETKTRMYNLVKNAKQKDRTLLEVDFSRWNLRWRRQTVDGVSAILEDIFGLPGVFSQAHQFFQKATTVMTDKNKLPRYADPTKPVTSWRECELVSRGKHLGGFEGIQQALWTLCTIAMMYWVLHDQNVSFLMAGQGDNQIFALTFNATTESTADQLRRLLGTMEARCKLLNHEVKPDECIDSSTVLTYSKDIYVEGNHILYNLKFSSRTFKRDEIDMPSLSTEIASISACSMACADSVYDTPKAIFWKTFQTLRFLSQRYRSENYEAERGALNAILGNKDKLKFAMLVPGSLGGLPVMSWTRFFMKGEVDDLSWDVPAVLKLGKLWRPLLTDLANVLDGKFTPKNPRLSQLILDPTSIPIERPKDLKRLVKDAVATKLPSITENVWIANIFNDQATEAGETLLQTLSSTRPFYPKIMSDIYALSPSGVRDALLSRFTMTRTINSVTGNPNFSSEIATANANLLRFVEMRYTRALERKSVNVVASTAYDNCKKLRELWGPDVQHVCIGVYNPFDFQLDYHTATKPMISAFSRCEDTSTLHGSLGIYPPNFGTKTRQKVSDHGFKIITSSSTVADLKTLILTASELGSHPTLLTLLNEICRARSPWSILQLMPILPTAFGGTAAHRHQDINRAAFSLLGSRTVPTHLNFSSDTAGVLSGGEFDYPIAFQEFYLTLTNIFQVLSFNSLISNNAGIGFVMTDTYEPIPDEPVHATETSSIQWKMQPSNKLVYVSELMVKEIPEVPSPSMIPHKKADELDELSLLYNYFLCYILRKQRQLARPFQVNLPVDILDLKEYSHATLHVMEKAITLAIQSAAIYTAVNEYTSGAHVFLNSLIYKLCQAVSGPFVRLFTHKQSQSANYVVEKAILMHPGASGATSAADNFSGYLYDRAVLSLRSRELPLTAPYLILFEDYKLSGYRQAECHWTAMLACCTSDIGKVTLTGYQRLQLSLARTSSVKNADTLHQILHLRSIAHLLLEQRQSFLAKSTKSEATLSPVCYFCPMIEREAIRGLRTKPLETRMYRVKRDCPQLSLIRNPGRVVFKTKVQEGHLMPDHVCEITHPTERVRDNFMCKLFRPYGMYSTALDVWLTIFAKYKKTFEAAEVTAIGVGHGASTTASLLLGARHAYGVDLRESFPKITQREANYVPPEVIDHGLINDFTWDKLVSTKGGNILDADETDFTRFATRDIVILDVELGIRTILPVLHRLQATRAVFVRILACDEWLRYCIDAFNAEEVYCTSAVRTTHKRSYILYRAGTRPATTLGNSMRVEIVEELPYRTATKKSMKRMLQIFNLKLAPLGVSLTFLSAAEILKCVADLNRRALNTPERQTAYNLNKAAIQLSAIVTAFRDPNTISLDFLLLLEPTYRTLLAQWLANSATPLTALAL
ncbi:RNA dependent RNA polymerase [Plasmopara viticola lesion associated mymonavirus 1]|uniref:RNA-directed RNA polymerase n=1 Tax=Plasmopara viticola lesion associated mymonavirus 1 TaxID=2692022 RepID=A0A6B9Q4D4_9MONO|nr:RNA dependent RNA polymerase [Plasmopara viticola lesion associated mymonavirus 1]QHD64779.1 RNA dependent RNA polymerase [Plasmopara viticola lesion associated mymonavirus 1]